MGSHLNYYWIIYYLIELKEELPRITKAKYQPLIKVLKQFEVCSGRDNDHLPNQNDLARMLNISLSNTYTLLRSLLNELVLSCSFSFSPLTVKNKVYVIHIALPYDEEGRLTRKERDEVRKLSTFICMNLPETPRIGDELSIPMVEETGRDYRGYVHNVHHIIKGLTQEIHIDVHPFHNYYHKLMKMKEQYEERVRWLRSLK